MRISTLLVTAGITLAATGCGGGGGGGVVRGNVQFTSFSAIKANEPTKLVTLSQRVNATTDADGDAKSLTLDPVESQRTKATLTVNHSGQPTRLAIDIGAVSRTWTAGAPGQGIACDALTCTGESSDALVILRNPEASDSNWNYQTFGLWIQNDSSPDKFAVALSMGAPTPGVAIPTAGTATYRGSTMGLHADASGQMFTHSAQLRADVNFGTRVIGLSTTGTQAQAFGATVASVTPAPHLDLNGMLAFSPGDNQLSGVLTAAGGMTGTATGRFYGPQAQEIGGLYGLTGAGPVEKMVGSFGGKTTAP